MDSLHTYTVNFSYARQVAFPLIGTEVLPPPKTAF